MLARAAGFCRIAGVDEAGRGPWAGPVVAAAVILRHAPRAVRLDDSKRLTEAQRQRAFDWLCASAEVGIGIVCADEIDRCNILQATLLAMEHACHDLPRPPDLILIDGTARPRLATPCWTVVHGDRRSQVIAAASIVAKVVRDRLMRFYHDLDARYAFHRHKGYGTAYHAQVLRTLGPSVLHRMSFRPVAAAALPRVVSGARRSPQRLEPVSSMP